MKDDEVNVIEVMPGPTIKDGDEDDNVIGDDDDGNGGNTTDMPSIGRCYNYFITT